MEIKISFEVAGIKHTCPTIIVEDSTPEVWAMVGQMYRVYLEGAKKRVADQSAAEAHPEVPIPDSDPA
jgi:hypothetical protein